MEHDRRQDITNYLSSYITEHRKDLMESVLEQRTNFVTLVLEDIYQPHNASAVVRSADCFGIQDVHIIEGRNKYDVNPQVLRGSGKWVNVIKYSHAPNNTASCFAALKKQGFKIVGTTPHSDGTLLPKFMVNEPIALVFGTEETGLSEYAMEQVDEYLRIPMYGFTESYNLSVSAAMCLYQIMTNLHASDIDFKLCEEDKINLRLAWYRKVVRRSEALVNEYLLNERT